VGWIGTLLPIVLIVSNMIFFTSPRPYSMSGYYYTGMRNVFVGALCALGVFLVAYAGYDKVDRWITNIAGFCAIGVAFFPTKPLVCAAHTRTCAAPSVTHLSAGQQAVGVIHLVFAAVTFVALGLMALRFAKSARTPGGQDMMGPDPVRAGTGQAERPPTATAKEGARCCLPRLRHRDLVLRGSRCSLEPAAGIGQGGRAHAVHLRGARGFRVRSLLVREGPDAPAHSQGSTTIDAGPRYRARACPVILSCSHCCRPGTPPTTRAVLSAPPWRYGRAGGWVAAPAVPGTMTGMDRC
jgi:hypothetical protein